MTDTFRPPAGRLLSRRRGYGELLADQNRRRGDRLHARPSRCASCSPNAPDDRLYLFAFSRDRVIRRCYDAFLKCSQKQIDVPDVTIHPRRDHPIEFLGVWDTVDAVGLPFPLASWLNENFRKYKVDVTEAPGIVRFGCQALALDEERESFAPVFRWKPRRLSQLCTAAGIEPRLHITVFDRTAQAVDGYAPANVPPGAAVNFTAAKDAANIDPPAIVTALTAFTTQFDAARLASAGDVSRGVVSYWLFVAGSIAAGLGLARILAELIRWVRVMAVDVGQAETA